MANSTSAGTGQRLIEITLDERSISRRSPDVEHEREVAIYDILEANRFSIDGRAGGPYRLHIALMEDRLVLAVREGAAVEGGGTPPEDPAFSYILSLSPFRRLVKDYFIVCDSYYQAIRSAPPSRIQAIDMGRRALHDEGAKLLEQRLAGKITVDFDTARRLFTLICALHWKG